MLLSTGDAATCADFERKRMEKVLEAAGIEIGNVKGHSLEDLLLELTGRSLRE